jgi:hypothetical protein
MVRYPLLFPYLYTLQYGHYIAILGPDPRGKRAKMSQATSNLNTNQDLVLVVYPAKVSYQATRSNHVLTSAARQNHAILIVSSRC